MLSPVTTVSYGSSVRGSRKDVRIFTNLYIELDQKHLERFEMWCWRRMEKISSSNHVRNEEVLLRVKEQRNILHEICKRKANWIGHICVETAFYNGLLKERYKGG